MFRFPQNFGFLQPSTLKIIIIAAWRVSVLGWVGAVAARKKRKTAKVLPFMPFNSETKAPEQDVASALTSRYLKLADLALKNPKTGDTEKSEPYLRYKSS